MTGKGRTGPRERQTMSGVLGEDRNARPTPSTSADAPPPPEAAPAAETGSASVVLDPLSLWKRMLAAAERDFERDGPTVERFAEPPPAAGRESGKTDRTGDRDEDGG